MSDTDTQTDLINDLQDLLGHHFKDVSLLKIAITHSSRSQGKNYERLEFLGDRVLGLIIAEQLYARFPDESEGDMAKRLAALVQGSTIAKIATKINLGDYIQFSDAERASGGADNENILADVFEAMLGALYLDSGFEACQNLVDRLWVDDFFKMKAPPQHPKTALQEWVQGQSLPLPEYAIVGQEGPDHAPIFNVRLRVQGHADITVQGRSRQLAEKDAARTFLKYIFTQGDV